MGGDGDPFGTACCLVLLRGAGRRAAAHHLNEGWVAGWAALLTLGRVWLTGEGVMGFWHSNSGVLSTGLSALAWACWYKWPCKPGQGKAGYV